MLKGEQLAARRGGRLVFHRLSFDLPQGETLAVRGANGSGKSTLLRLVAGLLPPAEGNLFWQGEPVRFLAERHRVRVHYVGHRDAVKPLLSVVANLEFWTAFAGVRAGRDILLAALAEFGLKGLADLPARVLSEGQRRRLALARLLVVPRPLWILDEPAAALDADGAERLTRALAAHHQAGGSVVMATHAAVALDGVRTLRLEDFAPLGRDSS